MGLRKYNNKWEAPFEVQLKEMREIVKRDDYELWIGDDGYAVSLPSKKIYDTLDNDESTLREVFGIGLSELMKLTVERCGTFYNLNPSFYREKTGCEYPYDTHPDGEPITVAVLSVGKTKDNIHARRFNEQPSNK